MSAARPARARCRALLAAAVTVTGGVASAVVRAAPPPAAGAAVPARLALVGPTLDLERAVRAALAPWPIEVLIVVGPVGRDDEARLLGASLGADVVAWLDADELRVIRVADGRAEARPRRGDDDDGPGAAATALSLKAILRLPATTTTTTTTTTTAPAPLPAPVTAPARTEAATTPPQVIASVGGGACLAGGDVGARACVGLGIGVRAGGDGAFVEVTGVFAPGTSVSRGNLRGTWSGLAIQLGGGWRQRLGPRWAVAAGPSLAIQRTNLEATSGAEVISLPDVALELGGLARATYLLGHWGLGAEVSGGVWVSAPPDVGDRPTRFTSPNTGLRLGVVAEVAF